MRTLLLIPFLLGSMAQTASPPSWIGHYQVNADKTVAVETDRGRLSFEFSTSNSQGTCTGDLTVFSSSRAQRLTLTDQEEEMRCTVQLTRTPRGMTVTESSGCSAWHGGSCSFAGSYRKTR